METNFLGKYSQWNRIALVAAIFMTLFIGRSLAESNLETGGFTAEDPPTWTVSVPLPSGNGIVKVIGVSSQIQQATFTAEIDHATAELVCQLSLEDEADAPEGCEVGIVQVLDDSIQLTYQVLSDGGGLIIALDEF